jgi:mannosyl-oligosaccharide alpha-1,2-mannosidase
MDYKFRRKPQHPPLFSQLRASSRKLIRLLIAVILFLSLLVLLRRGFTPVPSFNYVPIPIRPERYPIPPKSLLRLPRHRPKNIPKIQHAPIHETIADKRKRVARLQEVKDAFLHSWKGYKQEAWGKDELRPIEGGFKTPFCGWAATMVDSLDTLWIMGLREEFEISLVELRNVDFTNTEGCVINLFETTIRHLGGLLAAFDISGGRYTILVEKAVELAEVLITAFDTPNRMPSPHYLWSAYAITFLSPCLSLIPSELMIIPMSICLANQLCSPCWALCN